MAQNKLLLKETDTKAVSTNVFSLEQLFFMPLKAVIDANTMAAMAAIDIIKQYGFENDEASENYGKLKMVMFSYDYIAETGKIETLTISIPFITLIPLPILEVKHAEVNFALKVLGQLDIEVDLDTSEGVSQNLLAVFAPEKNNQAMNLSLEANMDINIKMGQSDLPGGIIQLLNLGQGAVLSETLFTPNYTPNELYFQAGCQLTLDTHYDLTSDRPKDIVFSVSVNPGYTSQDPPFIEPIQIIEGNPYGKATWKNIEVIPVVKNNKASFILQFSAGKNISNGFVTIRSNHSNQLKIYYSIK